MLTESAPPAANATILDELSRHMRLATGFAADQAAEIGDAFVAAVSHLEATLGLCLAPRSFIWRGRIGADGRMRAPIAPVRAIQSVDRIRSNGTVEALAVSGFTLDRRNARTVFCSSKAYSDEIEIAFDAGFGEAWTDTPSDLRRAVFMLAAHFFDQRDATGGKLVETPFAVTRLIGPWRSMRLTLGAA